MEEKEIWKDVKGYEGKYQISNLGNLRSLDRFIIDRMGRKQSSKGKIMNQTIGLGGYYFCNLRGNGKRKGFYIHRLVISNFIDNTENKRTVNHINGNKLDNRLSNLEWATDGENRKHAYDTGLQKASMTGRFGSNHNASKPVYQFDILGNFITSYGSAIDAYNSTGIDAGNIGSVCQKKLKTAGKYKWSFTKYILI